MSRGAVTFVLAGTARLAASMSTIRVSRKTSATVGSLRISKVPTLNGSAGLGVDPPWL